MDFLIVLAVVLVVAVAVTAPLRGDHSKSEEPRERGEVAELEAAKDAKYREIRDAELDYRTGKLSQEDWRALDGSLRAEAMELLRALDRVHGEQPAVG
jgi:hypothetical protein